MQGPIITQEQIDRLSAIIAEFGEIIDDFVVLNTDLPILQNAIKLGSEAQEILVQTECKLKGIPRYGE